MGNAKAPKPPAPPAPTAATAPAAPYHPHDKHGVDLGPGASSSKRGSLVIVKRAQQPRWVSCRLAAERRGVKASDDHPHRTRGILLGCRQAYGFGAERQRHTLAAAWPSESTTASVGIVSPCRGAARGKGVR